MRSCALRHSAAFQKEYEDRYVNNIYFDTLDFKNYYDNLNGLADRLKIRLRWYGRDISRIQNPALEIKYKRNLYSAKKIQKIHKHVDLKKLNWSSLFQVLSSQELERTLHRDAYMPVLCNRYLREYYRSKCGRFRLTLDQNLSYLPQSSQTNINLSRRRCIEKHTIVELKAERSYIDKLDRVCSAFPFRITKSSKYVIGVGGTL